jgi:hypothetical protein
MTNKLTVLKLVLGVALFAGFLSLFLPWVNETMVEEPPLHSMTTYQIAFGSGWPLLYFFVIVNLVGLFAIRTFAPNRLRLLPLPAADWLIYLIAGSALLAVGLLHLTELPPPHSYSSGSSYSASVGYGWVVGLVAAAAICAAAYLMRAYRQPEPRSYGWAAVRIVLGILVAEILAVGMLALIAFLLFAPRMM